MNVKCTNNKGNYSVLTLPIDETTCINNKNYISSHEWFTIDGEFVGYPLTQGNVYKVYAVFIIDSTCRYLVFDDDNLPQFFPSELFECVDNRLPFDWRFLAYETPRCKFSIVGPTLIDNYQFIVDLIDLRPHAVSKLIEYRDNLDFWES